MRLVILFDMLLNPSFKMTTSFSNLARTTAKKNYTQSQFQIIGTKTALEKAKSFGQIHTQQQLLYFRLQRYQIDQIWVNITMVSK